MYTFNHQHSVSYSDSDTFEVKEQKFLDAIKEHPDYKDELLRNLSFIYLLAGYYEKAIETIKAAIECCPAGSEKLGEYYGCLSLCLNWNEDYEGSLAAKEKSVELDPAEVEGIMQLAYDYYEAKDYKRSIDMYQRALFSDCIDLNDIEYHQFYNYTATTEDKEDNYKDNISLFRKLLKIAANDKERACAHFAISYLEELKENYSQAISHARKAKELLHCEFLTTIRLAESFSASGALDEANNIYEELPAIAKKYKWGNIIMQYYCQQTATICVQKNNYEGAAERYKKELEFHENPRTTNETLTQLAAIYMHQRQYELAKPWIDRIIELWPDRYPKSYASLAIYYGEGKEDYENALNYLMKASQVNRQTPENIMGMDSEEAASIYYYIGEIYYKHFDDIPSAITYFENALLCKPSKEIDEGTCTKLYEIYKKTGNEKRAAELKDRRTNIFKMLDMFNGDYQMPPAPGLNERLANPKNKPGEIEQLPYYYKNLPEDTRESLNFKARLYNEFYEDLLNNPAYKEYFSKCNPDTILKFCHKLAEHKLGLVEMAHYHMDTDEECDEKILRYYTERIFELIMQKKLWDKQLLWRAGKIDIPQVQIAYDFDIWSNQLWECPFIDVITPEEKDVMKQFLADDNFYDGTVSFLCGWQDYDKIIEKDEDDDMAQLPPWYEFYDSKMGTGSLLLLPNIRGEKEKEYTTLYHKWKHRQPPEPIVQHPPEPPYPNYLIGTDDEFTKFIGEFDNDYICRLHQQWLDDKVHPDKHYDEFAVREAIQELEFAEEPVHFDPSLNWYQAILMAAQKVKNSRISVYLDTVYESYKMKHELGLVMPGDLNKDNSNTRMRNMYIEQILKGRELNGEEKNFDY